MRNKAIQTDEERAQAQLVRQRKAWEKATSQGVTLREAAMLAVQTIRGANVRGKTVRTNATDEELSSEPTSLYYEVERAWTVGATLYVRFDLNWDRSVRNPDNDQEMVRFYDAHIELGWSATTRSVSSALAATTLYRELTELGAELEAILNERPIRSEVS